MKILLFTLEYPPFFGGVSKVYENIVNNWPEQDGIFVLHNNENKLIKNWLIPKWLPALFALYREMKKNNIEHILVGHILPLGTVAYLISRITKTKYSVFLHGMDFTLALQQPRKKRLAKRILENAENIICLNSYVARLVGEFLGAEFENKITVVNPGVEIRTARNPANALQNGAGAQLITQIKEKYNLQNKIVLLTVGRLVERKGVDMALKSLPIALKEIPNLFYAIVGRGEELENYQQQIIDNNLQNNAIIIADGDDEEKNAWYDLCDIFIMPARTLFAGSILQSTGNRLPCDFEGFGIVFLEANLAGKPVIAGDSGGVRDAVVDGYTGLLVNPESINEIVNSIVKLAKNKKLRDKLGTQGKTRAINEFNWGKQVQKIYMLLNSNGKISKL